VPILAAQNNAIGERIKFPFRDRMSWLRFPDFGVAGCVSDENSVRVRREC
jgi:hypothetical protein